MRVGEVESWTEAPAALAESYRRSRLINSSLTLASGTASAAVGTLELVGVTELHESDNAVVGALLTTAGLSSMSVGLLGLLRPLTDAELQAGRLIGTTDESRIRDWVVQRRVVAKRARIISAVGFGATGAGLFLSAAILQSPGEAEDVAGFDQLAGDGADLATARRALVAIGGMFTGLALFTGLRRGPEDRVFDRLEGDRPPPNVDVALTTTGALLSVDW